MVLANLWSFCYRAT